LGGAPVWDLRGKLSNGFYLGACGFRKGRNQKEGKIERKKGWVCNSHRSKGGGRKQTTTNCGPIQKRAKGAHWSPERGGRIKKYGKHILLKIWMGGRTQIGPPRTPVLSLAESGVWSKKLKFPSIGWEIMEQPTLVKKGQEPKLTKHKS